MNKQQEDSFGASKNCLTFHSWDWTVCFSFIPENISSKTIPRLQRSTAEVHSVSLWSPACARQFCSSASGARYPSVWIYFTSYKRPNTRKKLIVHTQVLHSILKSVLMSFQMGPQNTIAKLTESIVQPVVWGRQFNSLYCCAEGKTGLSGRKTSPSKTALTSDLWKTALLGGRGWMSLWTGPLTSPTCRRC